MDIEHIIKHSNEPELTRAVFDELKKYGDDVKKNYDELSDRCDDLEVMFKRPGVGPVHTVSTDDIKSFENSLKSFGKTQKISASEYRDYERAFNWYVRSGGNPATVVAPDIAKSMMVGSDPDGGYLVTPTMSNLITTRLYDGDPIRKLAASETIFGSDGWENLSDSADIDGGWVTETGSRDETAAGQLGKKRISVHELYAMPAATSKLAEDAPNLEQLVSMKAADKFLRLEGAAFVSGDGVGKPRGFLTYDNGTDWGQIEQVSLGGAVPTPDGIIDLIDALQEEYVGNAVMLMNRTTLNQLRKIKDGTGNYIFMQDSTREFAGFLFGVPVMTSASMPAVAASALSIAIADWKRAYMIVDRIGITLLRDPYTRKGSVLYYFKKRVGADVLNFDAIKIGICA